MKKRMRNERKKRRERERGGERRGKIGEEGSGREKKEER